MYNAFLERTKQTIVALSKHIQTSDRFRTALFDDALKCVGAAPCFDPALRSIGAAPDRLEWRIIDHCAAVTRIYAIYEQFAHEMIREHLSLLQSRISFSSLPEKLQISYRQGIAKILDKKDGPRFGDIDLGLIISNYDSAIKGEKYTLEARAMLMQEQNLRLPELDRFLSACGIDGTSTWVQQHRGVQAFFTDEDRITGSAESEMAELIKYRNDASHGSIDVGNILGVNLLVEFCDFITAVCEALAERVQLAGLKILHKNGHAQQHGKVIECFRGGMVVVGEVTGTFKVGSTVYLCGQNYCIERSLINLQVEGVDHDEIILTSLTELGMQFDAPGKNNALVMAIGAMGFSPLIE